MGNINQCYVQNCCHIYGKKKKTQTVSNNEEQNHSLTCVVCSLMVKYVMTLIPLSTH